MTMQPDRTDYHIHCNHDYCADSSMTLSAVYDAALEAGLQEICVLKHYSHELPNGEDSWVNWRRTKPEAFEAFLDAFRSTPVPEGLKVLSGVETEVLSDDGTVNIPDAAMEPLDLVLASNHWMPKGQGIGQEWIPLLTEKKMPASMASDDLIPWLETVKINGPLPYARALCNGNANAILKNPKVRVIPHFDDGFYCLRSFCIPVDDLSDDTLQEVTTPVVDACLETGALWEITPGGYGRRTHVIHEASRRGVRFTGTVDAHFLRAPQWGYGIIDHHKVEAVIRMAGLTRGMRECV